MTTVQPISIVIPMFNSADSIVKTLISCVEQTYLPKEIIIVDDCSSDNSLALVKQWLANYKGDVEISLKQLPTNSGPSKARNVGWELATGEYVSFLDADDLFMSNKLEAIVSVLKEYNDAVLLAHAYSVEPVIVNQTSEITKVSTKDLLVKNLFATPTVTIKRTIEERFDESMRYTEDHDLWLRITQRYQRTYYLDSMLTLIDRPVRSDGGQSANHWEMRRGEMKMYKKFCQHNNITVLYPLFVCYSLSKHLYKKIRQ